jgi:CrcB protein
MGYKLIGLAVAGACGALARYGLSGLFQRGQQIGFPWGTLTVNVLGCLICSKFRHVRGFLFGLICTLTQQRFAVSPETRAILLVGFLGSFTTFSAFLFETDQMLEQGEWLMAGLNLAGELGLGLAAYLLGAFLGRTI